MKIKYQFYLNQQKDEKGRNTGFFGYKLGDKLELAYTGMIEIVADEDGRQICERLFELFNINHPAGYRNRSMSVGDVVVLYSVDFTEHVVLRVASVGCIQFTTSETLVIDKQLGLSND